MRLLRVTAVFALGLWLAAAAARAQTFERLVMPGPVAKAHADLESDCSKCHTAFKRAEQDSLCLGCHDHQAIAADVRAKTGFHGRAPAVGAAQCRVCHPEHKGRDADIVGLDPSSFPHDSTDYPLRGAHERIACESCHESGANRRDAPADCAGCHASDDPHAGKLGRDCAGCHGEQRWREARFNHADTKFPLEGRHSEVACALCHAGERYEGTPRDCASCHQLNDVHRGRFGRDCASCHTSSRWKTKSFDHARKTRFPLTGKHASASCDACHPGGSLDQKLAMDCLSCHRGDDVHEGRNPADCESCHGTSAWKPANFDHDRRTEFPLRGAHREVSCESCHTKPVHEQKLGTSCASCHASDDVHRTQLGSDCRRCHGEVGWKQAVRFEHDLARFPLLGLHAVVACEECHSTPAYRDTKQACAACHERQDTHESRLGPRCELCHTPNGWKIWKFDHETQTEFPLRGAHTDLGCDSCHVEPVADAPKLASSCGACHEDEDPHRGSFGSSCERCHGEQSWRDVRIVR
ncbi:MAG: cytochrome C [Deltaproteobacteria bacterium]|nr:cytochrome C [Deltaproteobacteria bacterium]